MELIKFCPMCGKGNSIWVDEDAYDAWRNREDLIQNLFSDYNPTERELINTGFCPTCQDKLFGTHHPSERIMPYVEDEWMESIL